MNYPIFENLLHQNNIKFEKEVLVKNLMPEPENYKHKFRLDYLIIKDDFFKLAIEIEGGAYTNGRHTRGKGFLNDIQKYNSIIIAGYPLLRFSSIDIKNNPLVIVNLIKKYIYTEITTAFLSDFVKKHKKK